REGVSRGTWLRRGHGDRTRSAGLLARVQDVRLRGSLHVARGGPFAANDTPVSRSRHSRGDGSLAPAIPLGGLPMSNRSTRLSGSLAFLALASCYSRMPIIAVHLEDDAFTISRTCVDEQRELDDRVITVHRCIVTRTPTNVPDANPITPAIVHSD